MRQQIPLIAGTNQRTQPGMERLSPLLINMYPDSEENLVRWPGNQEEFDLGTGFPVDGLYESKVLNLRLAVSGGRVFKLDLGGVVTELEFPAGGSITAGVPVAFTRGGRYIFFAAASRIYKTDGVAITALAGGPTNVRCLGYLRGFLLADDPASVPGTISFSDDSVNNYASWEYFNNEASADTVLFFAVAGEQVAAVGTETIELSYLSGSTTEPFAPNTTATQNTIGAVGSYSMANDGTSYYFLAVINNSRRVIKMESTAAPQAIDFPVLIPVSTFERVDNAIGQMVSWQGESFYTLYFPTANVVIGDQLWPDITLAYDLQRQVWLILAYWNAAEGIYRAHRLNCFLRVDAWNKGLIGGRDGKIYSLFMPSDVDYTLEPKLMHRWRDNGSLIWKNPRILSLGYQGQTKRPLKTMMCGQYRLRQHELTFTDSSDAGDTFRATVRTGQIDHGSTNRKTAIEYSYNVMRGTSRGFALTSIEEEFEINGR